VIPDEYLVVFQKDFDLALRDKHISQLREKFQTVQSGEKIMHVYNIVDFVGYAAVLSPSSLQSERRNPNVRYVEPNREVKAMGFTTPSEEVQTNAPWGLDRIDQRQLPLDTLFHYFQNAGANVDLYVMDTGILLSHSEFGGRAIFGINTADQNNTDCNGHGTAVAGVAGGRTYGVAKSATVISVKTLGCNGSGTIAAVVAGADFITKQYVATKKPSVVSMAIGASKSAALDDAIRSSIAAGVSYAVSAGGSNADACNYSPSGLEEALTAASVQQNDTRSSFSNYGKCIDSFVPGQSITTAWIGSNTATNTISGTSCPAGFVAGVVAVHLGQNPTATPAEIKAWLDSVATTNIVVNPGSPDTPNRLLYSPYL